MIDSDDEVITVIETEWTFEAAAEKENKRMGWDGMGWDGRMGWWDGESVMQLVG